MAVNVTPGLEIPEPSDYSSCEDDHDVTYFTDLHQPDNNLPEPARTIDKLLKNHVDSAWEVISKQEKIEKDAQSPRQFPVLNATKEMKVCLHVQYNHTAPSYSFAHVLWVYLSKMPILYLRFFCFLVLSFQPELIVLCALRMAFTCFWVMLMVCQSSVHPLSPV